MMYLRRFIEEKWVRNDKIYHFWAEPAHWYRYQKWVLVPKVGTGTHYTEGNWYRYHLLGYRYPFTREGMVPVPNKGGVGTRASSNPVFVPLALLSLVFIH